MRIYKTKVVVFVLMLLSTTMLFVLLIHGCADSPTDVQPNTSYTNLDTIYTNTFTTATDTTTPVPSYDITDLNPETILANSDISTDTSIPASAPVSTSPADLFGITEMNETMIVSTTSSDLIVRSGPGANFSLLGYLTKGSVITVTGFTDNGWYRFNFNGQAGYSAGNYLKKYNLNSTSNITPPKTEIPIDPIDLVNLDVPMILQRPELPYGCEIVSVTMMLQHSGAVVDKISLANEMPYHASDPNKGYVGDPFKGKGKVNAMYPASLAGIIDKYSGGKSYIMTGLGMEKLKSQLKAGYPVAVWMRAQGFSLHCVCVTGYDSKYIYINDPWVGQLKLTHKDFLDKWNAQKQRAISYMP